MLSQPGAFAAAATDVAAPHVKAQLVSEVATVGPGQAFWVALEFEIGEGWHTYWRNPGDSGKATTLQWQLPPGFMAGDIMWSAPQRFDIPPLVNYGYAVHAVHLVKITAPASLQAGASIKLLAQANWLVCSDLCIPESAQLTLKLSASSTAGVANPAHVSLFDIARSELPRPQPAPVTLRIQAGQLIMTLAKDWGASLRQITSLTFFPYDEGVIDYAAQQTMTRDSDVMELSIRSGHRVARMNFIRGVLLATQSSHRGAIAVPIEISASR
jgi:DsbC/DsbD-like thiol-disulfide interchange protein